MTTIHLVLLIFSFCSFTLCAISPTAPQWNRTLAIGLATFVASMISW